MSVIVGVPPKIVTPTVEQINSDRITEVTIVLKRIQAYDLQFICF